MRYKKIIILACCLSTVFTGLYAQSNTSNNLQYLKPEIGGVGHLLQPTRPTIQLPYQMLRMTPDRNDYLDDRISNFPLQIPSHRMGYVFSIMPVTDPVVTPESWHEQAAYDQDLEDRSPWHYQNYFTEKDISIDFVPSQKAAIFRFQFPAHTHKTILFGAYNGSPNYWKKEKGNAISGMQYFEAEDNLKPVAVYMYGEFNAQPRLHSEDGNDIDSLGGNHAKAYCDFASDNNTIEFRYAISYISPKQAKRNFDEEVKGISLEALSEKAKQAWADVFSQIQVEGGTKEQKESF